MTDTDGLLETVRERAGWFVLPDSDALGWLAVVAVLAVVLLGLFAHSPVHVAGPITQTEIATARSTILRRGVIAARTALLLGAGVSVLVLILPPRSARIGCLVSRGSARASRDVFAAIQLPDDWRGRMIVDVGSVADATLARCIAESCRMDSSAGRQRISDLLSREELADVAPTPTIGLAELSQAPSTLPRDLVESIEISTLLLLARREHIHDFLVVASYPDDVDAWEVARTLLAARGIRIHVQRYGDPPSGPSDLRIVRIAAARFRAGRARGWAVVTGNAGRGGAVEVDVEDSASGVRILRSSIGVSPDDEDQRIVPFDIEVAYAVHGALVLSPAHPTAAPVIARTVGEPPYECIGVATLPARFVEPPPRIQAELERRYDLTAPRLVRAGGCRGTSSLELRRYGEWSVLATTAARDEDLDALLNAETAPVATGERRVEQTLISAPSSWSWLEHAIPQHIGVLDVPRASRGCEGRACWYVAAGPGESTFGRPRDASITPVVVGRRAQFVAIAGDLVTLMTSEERDVTLAPALWHTLAWSAYFLGSDHGEAGGAMAEADRAPTHHARPLIDADELERIDSARDEMIRGFAVLLLALYMLVAFFSAWAQLAAHKRSRRDR